MVVARALAVLAVASLLVPAPQRGGLAQEATPAGTTGAVPPPAACRVAPRSLAALRAAGTSTAAPTAVATPAVLPAGTPADPATVAAIVAVTRERIACNNANDLLRILAFFTDEYLRRTVDFGALARALDLPPTPVPAALRQGLVAVRDVRLLADGRVGAVVVTETPSAAPPTQATFVRFRKVGDRWLIDDLTDLPPDQATT